MQVKRRGSVCVCVCVWARLRVRVQACTILKWVTKEGLSDQMTFEKRLG